MTGLPLSQITRSAVVVAFGGGEAERGHDRQLLRHHVDHVAFVLNAAGDHQRRLQVDQQPAWLKQPNSVCALSIVHARPLPSPRKRFSRCHRK
jgi:hypothetical protein